MDVVQAPWWDIASTVVTAMATGVLALFAGVQMVALGAQRKERERIAGARIAATGFLLRRQVRSWLGQGPGSEDQFETWIQQALRNASLAKHLDVAESRIVEMLAHAPEATKDVAASVRTAAVLFFNGANRLNEFTHTPQPDGKAIADWVDFRNVAWRDLRDCVRELDAGVGIGVLLKESQILEAKRRAEFPSNDVLVTRLAEGLAKLEETQAE